MVLRELRIGLSVACDGESRPIDDANSVLNPVLRVLTVKLGLRFDQFGDFIVRRNPCHICLQDPTLP